MHGEIHGRMTVRESVARSVSRRLGIFDTRTFIDLPSEFIAVKGRDKDALLTGGILKIEALFYSDGILTQHSPSVLSKVLHNKIFHIKKISARRVFH